MLTGFPVGKANISSRPFTSIGLPLGRAIVSFKACLIEIGFPSSPIILTLIPLGILLGTVSVINVLTLEGKSLILVINDGVCNPPISAGFVTKTDLAVAPIENLVPIASNPFPVKTFVKSIVVNDGNFVVGAVGGIFPPVNTKPLNPFPVSKPNAFSNGALTKVIFPSFPFTVTILPLKA